jgi:hypothetical protein
MKPRSTAIVLGLALVAVTAALGLQRACGRGELARTEGDAGAPAHEGPPPAAHRRASGAPAAPGPGAAGAADGGAAVGRIVVRGRWGAARGEFGHRPAQESNPEAPMSFVVGRGGALLVLDQVNGRVQRFNPDGTPTDEVHLGAETAQDLALDARGNLLVLDRLGKAELTAYGPDGQPREQIPVVGGPIAEGGAVTGLFTDPSGTYLEREHTETARVAGPDGKPDPARPTEPGRPSRDGRYYLWAAIADRIAGVANVRVFDRDASLLWGQPVAFPTSIVHLLLLDSDGRGFLYLGALVGEEAGDELTNLTTIVLRLRLADGAPAGALALPPNQSAAEVFRELAVGDDGAIYQMLPGPEGLTITRYTFP